MDITFTTHFAYIIHYNCDYNNISLVGNTLITNIPICTNNGRFTRLIMMTSAEALDLLTIVGVGIVFIWLLSFGIPKDKED